MSRQATAASLTNYAPDVLGRVEPRLWTPPLVELAPETSFGYDLIEFAEAIGWPFDEWQKWLAIHIGELLPDGRPRFRMALALVARQNGKTTFVRVLTLYWMFIERVALVLGTSTNRDLAKESWQEVVKMAEDSDLLSEELGAKYVRTQMGEETFWNAHGSRYRFSAKGRKAGRSLTVHRLILDELREHTNRDTYNAAVPAMNAVMDGQCVAITNQGDENSTVLDDLRDGALEYIETGVGDSRLGLFEWSSPNGADPTDPEALAYANPDLNRGRLLLDNLMGEAIQAKRAGGRTLADFRTEYMCQRVTLLDPAIDPDAWAESGTDEPVDLADHRRRVALGLDVALDGSHATLVAAAKLDDGLVRVEVVHKWQGFGCTKALRAELPGLVAKLRPRTVGWQPGGPTAAVAADLAVRGGANRWPPRGVTAEEITGDIAAACMGLADLVLADELEHPNDAMLTQHVSQAQRLNTGDRFTFTRRGSTPIDGAYALAIAVHLARTLPPPLAPVEAG